VHRGWIVQKNVLEKPLLAHLTPETVALQGQLVPALARAFELTSPKYSELGLWQNHDVAAHSKLLGVQLDNAVLVLSPASQDAEAKTFKRDNPANAEKQWQEKADKNLGYAVQWLGLALVGLFGLLWMLVIHKKTPLENSTLTKNRT
jgi:cytochrome oxidase assembly protein ShyY1